MAVPSRQITAAALVGDACLLLVLQCRSRRVLLEAFAMLWLLQFLAWGIWHMYVYPHFASPLRHLPQPRQGHWLYGHRNGLHPGDIGLDAKKWVQNIRHNDFIRYLDVFNRETLLVTSPRAISEILVSQNYSFPKSTISRTILGRYTGYGIGVADGDDHKAQRRKLSPAFSLKHIRELYPTFWAKGDEAALAMAPAAGQGAAIDIHAWAVRCALDVIGITSMGYDFCAVADEDLPLVRAYSQLTAASWQDGLLILLETVVPKRFVARLPLRRSREVGESLNLIHAACRKGIQATKKSMAVGLHTRPDICSVGLEAGFTDDQLVEQLNTFLFAGQHAIAKTLTAAVYALCCFPEKQAQLRQELRSRLPRFFGPEGGQDLELPSYTEIDGLPYLNAVVKEVLRKYSVGTSSREAKCDSVVQGLHIPRGTAIQLATHATSNDPELWGEDADDFRPERWLETKTASAVAGAQAEAGAGAGAERGATTGGASSNYAFLPFMYGPQGCMAVRFAQAELACLLAAWFGRVEFRLWDESLRDEAKLPRRALQTELLVSARLV
ncbi:hypothetical protein L249_5579 [Ophiocordyceps polyrhachis-furcata BCC 54312]|uniref:Cytochrome P450 n=1 Tax=Ophiocordyceps polyrhachis-furcata BCC 54312 TaxID=1330021 RepID=A0A367LGU6_9HYPO|nr:hypothetical protein L249_5579 [Ophiocordyceps polyrhachis-furcata BCC 54312]